MAKVLTGISGNLISAASAGFAPTNSADVSAIASAYQVVSSTATQLYAGTEYVTSVNGAPLSASRAGNAANASMANSAYYDGTGRLISSLPDSAAVSAIASAYQVVSSTATAVTGETAYLTGVNETPISAARAGNAGTATVAFKAYTDTGGRNLADLVDIETLDSWTSGKQDTLTFAYNADSAISSINGSALAGQGGGGEQVVTSLQYAVSEATSTYELYQPAGTMGSDMSSNLLAINDPEYGMGKYELSGLSSFDVFMTGMDSNFEYYSASMSAMIVKASASALQPWVWSTSDTAFCGPLVSVHTGRDGYTETGSARVSAVYLQHYGSSWPDGTPFYIQPPLIFFTNRVNPVYNGTARIGTAYGSASYVNTAAGGKSSVSGVNELPIYIEKDTSVSAIAETYAQSAVSSVSSDYYPRYLNPSNFVPSSAVVMRSSVGSSDNFITSISGTPLMATDSALARHVSDTASATAYRTAYVNFEPDSVSRSVIVRLPNNGMAYITAFDSNGYTVDSVSINLALDPENYTYTGQYVVTSTSAVSAGVFSYQSLSASAICGYTVPLAHASALPTYSYDTEDKISAINGSAIAGGAGGVDSATVSAIASSYAESAVSSYQPLSGMSGYASAFSAGEGLEFVQSGSDQVLQVEAPVDIVAGPGIVIDNPDGNTLRVSMAADYEVTLFETTSTDGYGVLSGTLSEAYTNFEYIEIYGNRTGYNWNGMNLPCHDRIYTLGSPTSFHLMSMLSEGGNANTFYPSEQFTLSSSAFAYKGGANYQAGSSGMSVSVNNFNGIGVQRIVGIHRIANN